MKVGDVYWCGDTGPANDPGRAHMSIILNIDTSNGTAVTVPIVSNRMRHRAEWTLEPSKDHPFIQHPSIIVFASARRVTIASIEAALSDPRAMCGALSADKLADTIEHLRSFPATPASIREEFSPPPRRILPTL